MNKAASVALKSLTGLFLIALLIAVQTMVFSDEESFESSYDGLIQVSDEPLSNETLDETILLNFRDVDIRTLIGEVSRITGKNFIIDPFVSGKITVNSSRPLNADQLYDAFLSILQVNGYVAIPSGDMIKIVLAVVKMRLHSESLHYKTLMPILCRQLLTHYSQTMVT